MGLGSSLSDLSISGGGLLRRALFGVVARCCETACVCIIFLAYVVCMV